MTTMELILLRNDPLCKDSKPVARDRLAANRALMGDSTLIKLTVWNGQYNRTIIPTASLLRDGVLGNLKQLLYAHRIRGMHISNAEKDAMVKCVTLGMPLVIPKAALLRGRDPTSSGEYRLGNIMYPVARPFFQMPIFPISPHHIPTRAIDIINKFLNRHPHTIIPITMALQKCLLYFYIISQEQLMVEPLLNSTSKYSTPMPSVPLAATILLGPAFEAYHQIYELSAYMHPFRAADWLVRSPQFPKTPGMLDFNDEQELRSLLHPFLKPSGAVLPCSYPGSSIPDLTHERIEEYLHQDDIQVKAALLPDWQAVYFSDIPVRTNFALGQGKKRPGPGSILCTAWVPSSFTSQHQIVLQNLIKEPNLPVDPWSLDENVVFMFPNFLDEGAMVYGPTAISYTGNVMEEMKVLLADLKAGLRLSLLPVQAMKILDQLSTPSPLKKRAASRQMEPQDSPSKGKERERVERVETRAFMAL
jgi:hypothetical protein